MKKSLSILLSLVMILTALPLTAINSFADTSGYYTYTVSNGKATITECDTSISGNVTIPSELGGYPVTSIGVGAFYNCSSLTSIIIPDSVTNIESFAFNGCTSLESMAISNNVTSIGVDAFYNCTSLESITIPDSVTSIESFAFNRCTSLKNIKFGCGVISIGDFAFENCTSLKSITIPDSVKSMGIYTFGNCDSLENVTIGNSVAHIGEHAFYKCTSLTSVTLGSSVVSIENSAFSDCISLTSIILSDSVKNIEDGAFWYCNNLKTVYYSGSETDWENISIYDYNESLTNANIIFNSYIVYLNANGGECSQSAIVLTNENEYVTLPTPTRAKHRFEGWYTQAESGTKIEEVSISPNHSTQILYAHWLYFLSAEIIQEPSQTTYYIGDKISLNGAKVKITYYDGTTKIAEANELTPICDTSTAGKNKDLVISYTEEGETITATTKITVKKPSARSYCDGLETDEIYLVGSGRFTLETTPSGLPARWESSDEGIIYITSDGYYRVTGRGETKITAYFDYNGITYEKDVLINVTGTAKSVTNVNPAKDSYYVGEEFNNKVSFHAVIDDGFGNISEVDVVDHRGPDGDTSTPGKKTVTFDYFGVTVSYTYTVGIVIEDSETDVNGDGKLTVVDAKWILQSVAGTRTLTDEQKIAADVNGDDKVTVVDAKWILQAIAGMRDLSKK